MFLMRCLFTMFAEDVEPAPGEILQRACSTMCRTDAGKFVPLLDDLWHAMNDGDFAASIREPRCKHFNGNLFADARALPLGREEIGELCEPPRRRTGTRSSRRSSARCSNRRSIQTSASGSAHITRRAPMSSGWSSPPSSSRCARIGATCRPPPRPSALRGDTQRRRSRGTGVPRQALRDAGARSRLRHRQFSLCLAGIDEATGRRGAGGAARSRRPGSAARASVSTPSIRISFSAWKSTRARPRSPNWCCGSVTCNGTSAPRAARPTEPILQAVQEHPGQERGADMGRLSGRRRSSTARRPIRIRARPEWPQAEFIVGNPPFIGGKDLRARLGDAYAEALWAAHQHINESADFVMYWWDRAAELLTVKGHNAAPLRPRHHQFDHAGILAPGDEEAHGSKNAGVAADGDPGSSMDKGDEGCGSGAHRDDGGGEGGGGGCASHSSARGRVEYR